MISHLCTRILFLVLLGFCSAQAQVLTSSNLPIIILDTKGNFIGDDPKITAHMGIIDNGAGNRNNLTDRFTSYDGLIGIELRGNATQSFEKKSYGFETRDEAGEDLKVSLLGMPSESDWILSGAYIDKTLMRDPLAYYMSRGMGRWASRTKHCELVINGTYQGIYILEEKIKRDENRVDIAKLLPADTNGDELTGGYIYEVAQDGPDFGNRRRFVYPKGEDITSEQIAFIKKYDDDFRQVMAGSNFNDPDQGYSAWIDVESFIDEILIQEACKNSDAYGWSSYFHKDKSEKLKAGPAWDFDQALSNSTFNDGPNYSEWIINKYNADYPLFWTKLFNERSFKRLVRMRWNELRSTTFATSRLQSFIDSVANHLEEAQVRNFQRWNILGKEVWRSTPGFEQRDTYQKEVNNLKTFLSNRLAWMDAQLPMVITASEEDEKIISLNNYPNPASDITSISYNLPRSGLVTVAIYDAFGRRVDTLVSEHQLQKGYVIPFRAQQLPGGVYFYTLQLDQVIMGTRKMVVTK